MGTIRTTANKLSWDINQAISNTLNNAKSAFESAVGRVQVAAGTILNGDVVGINENEIPNMKIAIQEYITTLENHLQTVKRDAETSQAFKGEYAMAVKEFVGSVCDACEAIISNLRAFEGKLDEVHRAYLQKDSDISADIKSQATDIAGSFKKYDGGQLG